MHISVASLIIAVSLLPAISACQPKGETAAKANTRPISINTDQPSEQMPVDAAASGTHHTNLAPSPALHTNMADRADIAQACSKLSAAMQDIDDTSNIEDIHSIQQQLELCLPSADNPTVLQWLKDYQALYGCFLNPGDNNIDDEPFYTVMAAVSEGKKAPPALLKALDSRVQYLIGLVEQKAGVSVLYLGEGIFTFHHDLQAMAALFIPYLQKDQAEFVQRMAEDNQDIFWNDAAVAISYNELIERAVFWENYIQRYPSGFAVNDAKQLLSLYRYVLFYGSENSQWTDDAIHKFLSPEYQQAMQ